VYKPTQTDRCGGCTLCCTVLEIPELPKPAWTDCPNCTSTSCSVWESKPISCQRFVCLWYAHSKFPDSLRPDHCGVVFEPAGKRVLLAMINQDNPNAWKEGIAWTLIKKFVADGTAVIVQIKSEKHFLLPEGDSVSEVWKRVIENARGKGLVN